MAISKARKPEQPNVNEAPFGDYASTPQTFGSDTVPTYSSFRIEGNNYYQQTGYNLSVANFNYQMSDSRGHDYYNQQPNTLQHRQFYNEPFEFGTTYGYTPPSQRHDSLSAMTHGYSSMRM